MSHENVELVRRQVQAFNDRDIPALESIFSEDFVYRLIGGFADLMGTEFRGQDAALAWVKEWTETIDARAEIETIREVNEQVLTILHIAATGAASGVGTTLRVGQFYSFRDGRISALDAYYTPGDALKALGLAG
jgi:ketosteroid isomerase-like protein